MESAGEECPPASWTVTFWEALDCRSFNCGCRRYLRCFRLISNAGGIFVCDGHGHLFGCTLDSGGNNGSALQNDLHLLLLFANLSMTSAIGANVADTKEKATRGARCRANREGRARTHRSEPRLRTGFAVYGIHRDGTALDPDELQTLEHLCESAARAHTYIEVSRYRAERAAALFGTKSSEYPSVKVGNSKCWLTLRQPSKRSGTNDYRSEREASAWQAL